MDSSYGTTSSKKAHIYQPVPCDENEATATSNVYTDPETRRSFQEYLTSQARKKRVLAITMSIIGAILVLYLATAYVYTYHYACYS
jgi:hypothetical protein